MAGRPDAGACVLTVFCNALFVRPGGEHLFLMIDKQDPDDAENNPDSFGGSDGLTEKQQTDKHQDDRYGDACHDVS